MLTSSYSLNGCTPTFSVYFQIVLVSISAVYILYLEIFLYTVTSWTQFTPMNVFLCAQKDVVARSYWSNRSCGRVWPIQMIGLSYMYVLETALECWGLHKCDDPIICIPQCTRLMVRSWKLVGQWACHVYGSNVSWASSRVLSVSCVVEQKHLRKMSILLNIVTHI